MKELFLQMYEWFPLYEGDGEDSTSDYRDVITEGIFLMEEDPNNTETYLIGLSSLMIAYWKLKFAQFQLFASKSRVGYAINAEYAFKELLALVQRNADKDDSAAIDLMGQLRNAMEHTGKGLTYERD